MPTWTWRRLHRVEGLDTKAVIFTLDVGARVATLEKVLDVLHREEVHTTVFLYTGELSESPRGADVVRRIAAEGHELANHTRSHADLTKVGVDEVGAELDAVEDFVRSATGGTTKPFFREPFLASNDETDRVVRERCYRSIWFTVDTGDWQKGRTSADIVRAVLEDHHEPRKIESGSIFIFHGSQAENLTALPTIIASLKSQGFAFLTLGEALRRAHSSPPEPK